LGEKEQAVQAYVKSLEYGPSNTALKDWLNQYAPGSVPTPVPITILDPDATPVPGADGSLPGMGSLPGTGSLPDTSGQAPALPGLPGLP
jgi:hypothetical protein